MIKNLADQLRLLLLLLQLLGYLAVHLSCPQQRFCPEGQMHVACAKITGFDHHCEMGPHKIVHVNGALRGEILSHVNMLRNFVASGLFGMKPAARMPTVSWDKYLARMSERLLRLCDREGKFCSNSEKYRFVATVQLFITTNSDGSRIARDVISRLLPAWFMDVVGCHMSTRDQLSPGIDGKCVGHFIPLIQDHGNRIGCSIRISQTTSRKQASLSMICNLSRANVNSMPHYETNDVPGQFCQSGRNRLYKFLCDPKEPVDNNFVPLTAIQKNTDFYAAENPNEDETIERLPDTLDG